MFFSLFSHKVSSITDGECSSDVPFSYRQLQLRTMVIVLYRCMKTFLSFAIEYSTHFSRDSISIGLIFHCLVGSLILSWNLLSCSSSLTENQYLISMIPDRISILSNSGHDLRNSSYSSFVQKPITFSTPARLYQLLSNNTISPSGWQMFCISLKNTIVFFSFSVGVPRATTLHILGLRHPGNCLYNTPLCQLHPCPQIQLQL